MKLEEAIRLCEEAKNSPEIKALERELRRYDRQAIAVYDSIAIYFVGLACVRYWLHGWN